MKNLVYQLFSISSNSWSELLVRLLVMLIITLVFYYMIFFISSKLIFRRNKSLHSDHRLILSSLWSIVIYLFLFTCYFFFVIYYNGTGSIHWTNYQYYLGGLKSPTIFHYLFIYLLIIFAFFILYINFKKNLKKT